MLAERVSSTSPLRQMMRSLRRREKMSAARVLEVHLVHGVDREGRCTCLVAAALGVGQLSFECA